jgi:hypothetical protein
MSDNAIRDSNGRNVLEFRAVRLDDKAPVEDHTAGNGGGDGMDGRIRALESGMTDVKVSLGKIETRLDHIEKNMVTKGQMAIWALLGLVTFVGTTGTGAWWIAQQYLSPILKALPK